MNKKSLFKVLGLLFIIVLTIIAIFNIFEYFVSGKQYIKINMASNAYTNSDLCVSIVAQENGKDVDTKTELKLLDSDMNEVKDVKIKYEGNNAILSIPEIGAGNYNLEAKVSSNVGQDTIRKKIYLADGKKENVSITLDKGIYKPGDTLNYRALLTSLDNDTPVSKDLNVSIYDGNDNKVYNENIKSSDYGIVSGKFNIASEVNSGVYKLVVKTNNSETTKQFKVNPYVTPKYEVKVKFDKENYIVNDVAKITVNAKYFFGEPVKDANITLTINNEKQNEIKTDENGNATIDYIINKANTYSVKAEVVDSSNYFVEASNKFIAGTDVFEVQLLPVYGTLASGKKNDVYVFTKKMDETPVKTYVSINSDGFVKQIATDENGVGKFSIDVESNNKYNAERKFNIVAEDMDKNKVSKNINLKIENRNLLVATDKVKYNQGEDIKIKIASTADTSKNVYFFKNNNLIKMLKTESNDTTINLDDNYGLIDILVTDNNRNTFKKTVFVKPTKQLKIGINTDKQEYKPGEKIDITVKTTNESNSEVDAALLVSMLDNSILELADNDLSIDNIKLALQNVKFSNELDAATLYSCIIDDNSEQTMMALLLKQSIKDLSVSEIGMYNTEGKDKAGTTALLLLGVILVGLIIYASIKMKKFAKGLKHILTLIIFSTLVFFTTTLIGMFRTDLMSTIIFSLIVSIAIYLGGLHKLNDKKLFRTTLSIYIVAGLIALWNLLINIWEIPTIAILVLIIIIKKNKDSKRIKKLRVAIGTEVGYIILLALAVGAAFLVVLLITQFLPAISNTRYYSGDTNITLVVIIFTVSLYFFNYKINAINTKTLDQKNKPKANVNRTPQYNQNYNSNNGQPYNTNYNSNSYFSAKAVAITLGIILVVFLITIGSVILNQGEEMVGSGSSMSSPKYSPEQSIDSSSKSNSNSGYSSGSGVTIPSASSGKADAETSTQSSGSTSSLNDILSEADEFIGRNNKEKNDEPINSNINQETQKTTDEHIRNVFLESMCFIPELVTSNGTAKTELELSDNITTWTIQTVGNTKDGRVGYGSIDNVKVFKDFFVDFELPKNLVEGDKVSIPVTVHNYTENSISTVLKVKEEDWFTLENNNINISVSAKSTGMVYVPITVNKKGNNKFRAEVASENLTDIVEKECTVSPKGYKVEKVVSTGNLDEDISEDILILDDIVENTAKAKVKIYASTMSQTVEGMENIFRMPTGCFEQISSSLYPNILALNYLETNGLQDEKIKEKALSYISSGYQKLLTYEVKGEEGGYSLYGRSPAETVLTAYGLMEIKDLSKVYDVDNNVIEKMTKFLYGKQNSNGTFKITGSHLGGANSRNELSLNAYITWALSESNPNDSRLRKSVDYLKGKIDSVDDNYTLALIANVLVNVGDNQSQDVLKKLANNVKVDGKSAYLTSNVVDYYGSRSNVQTVQTVALTSMAFSKASYNNELNKSLVNYLIEKKDSRGTWYSTQATILALKAINTQNEKKNLENQTITVKVNSDEKKIEIKDNPIELYELTFENLSKENKLNIDIEKGNAYYEVIEEHYVPYEKVETKEDNIKVSVECNRELRVNEKLNANIRVINMSQNTIANGMVTINIPQGFTVIEDSLMELESKGTIEKYEMSYSAVNIYLRNTDDRQIVDLPVSFRASYPVEITGMSVRAYDYYNPTVEGKTMPISIKVNQ